MVGGHADFDFVVAGAFGGFHGEGDAGGFSGQDIAGYGCPGGDARGGGVLCAPAGIDPGAAVGDVLFSSELGNNVSAQPAGVA